MTHEPRLFPPRMYAYLFFLFTCGRRPAGLLATPAVVGVVGGGGNNFYTWVLGEPMYGFEKFKARSYIFVIFSSFLFQKPMYALNAHVWSRRGVTPHSEIVVGDSDSWSK